MLYRLRPELEVERLEDRLYLSAPGHAASSIDAAADPGAHFAALVANHDSYRATELPVRPVATQSPNLFAVDVGRVASNSVLAVFDPVSGDLLAAIPVSDGPIILFSNGAASDALPDWRLGPDGSPWLEYLEFIELAAADPAAGDAGAGSNFTQEDRPQTDGNLAPPIRGMASGAPGTVNSASGDDNRTLALRPRVILVLPGQSEPARPSRGVREPAVRVPADKGSAGAPDGSIPLAPTFNQWLSVFNRSVWSHATDLPGVQARVRELLERGLPDEGMNGSAQDLDDGGAGGLSSSSRMLIRSPQKLMIFTTPRSAVSHGGSELAIYNFVTGELTRPGYTVSGRLFRAGSEIAFLSNAGFAGVESPATLQLFDPLTLNVRDTGIAAETIQMQGGQLILGIRATQGEGAGRLAAFRYDPRTGKLENLNRWLDRYAVRIRRELMPFPDPLEPSNFGPLHEIALMPPIEVFAVQFTRRLSNAAAGDQAAGSPAGAASGGDGADAGLGSDSSGSAPGGGAAGE